MTFQRVALWMYVLSLLLFPSAHSQKQYDMDKLSTCGNNYNVDDDGVRINARGAVSPSNPPLRCVIYLRSIYTRKDGSNKMQIEVESLSIRDSAITLDIFEGRRSVGTYIKRLSYREGSTAIIYSKTNEITIRLTRPDVLYQPEYRFSLLIKPWKDRNVLTPNEGKETISVAAIIGIIFGCLLLVALVILFCWCCCTGRVSGIKGKFPRSKDTNGIVKESPRKDGTGVENKALAGDKGKPGVINFNDPVVWNTVTTGNYENQRSGPRYFQRNAPRNDVRNGDYQRNAPRYDTRNDGRNDYYENQRYDDDRQQREGQGYRRNGQGYNRQNGPSQADDYENNQIKSVPKESKVQQPAKETLIDDVFESDSGNQDGDVAESDVEDATLQKRPPGGRHESPKTGRKTLPEEKTLDDGSPQLERYKSMDLQSQPDLDTISSPLHVNAGVRASVEDDDISPSSSLRKQKKGGKSPKSKRRGEGGHDPSAMPPEAFEPIFSAPITGIDYPSYRHEAPPAYPGGMMPYGLIPAMHFAPGVPGTQTYAYAYQTAPGGGPPAAQGAYIVQNTPTADGNKRTAFAVEHTLSPEKSDMGDSTRDRRRKNSDPFRRHEHRNSGGSKRSKTGKNGDHDLSVITRGAAPPDPGPGHRSVAMKSGTDPNTGIQTTQVLWTDTVPDPTDPKPGDNPQITRKTITRVTTKSGYDELPPEPTSLLELNNSEPAFLSPSRQVNNLVPSHPNAAVTYTPQRGNIAFYTGEGTSEVTPPVRSSTPTSVHHITSYNNAIRDRIPLDDSTV